MQQHHYSRDGQTQPVIRRLVTPLAHRGRFSCLLSSAALAIAALILSGCQRQKAAMAMPAPEVEIATVAVRDVPVTKE